MIYFIGPNERNPKTQDCGGWCCTPVHSAVPRVVRAARAKSQETSREATAGRGREPERSLPAEVPLQSGHLAPTLRPRPPEIASEHGEARYGSRCCLPCGFVGCFTFGGEEALHRAKPPVGPLKWAQTCQLALHGQRQCPTDGSWGLTHCHIATFTRCLEHGGCLTAGRDAPVPTEPSAPRADASHRGVPQKLLATDSSLDLFRNQRKCFSSHS